MPQTREERCAQRAAYFQANKHIIREKLREKAAALAAAGYALPPSGEKACAQCAVIRPIAHFTKCASAPDGHSYRCKTCDRKYSDPVKAKARSDAWYAANKERRAAKTKAWTLANPVRVREMRRAYREANKEKIDAGIAKWQRKNPDRRRAIDRRWAEKHPEQRRAISQNYRLKNPEKMAAQRDARRARLQNAEGNYTAEDVRRIAIAQRRRCAYCRQKLGKPFHIDHIIALSRGGTNWPRNIQLTCVRCNLTKHAKDPVDFARQIGRLL